MHKLSTLTTSIQPGGVRDSGHNGEARINDNNQRKCYPQRNILIAGTAYVTWHVSFGLYERLIASPIITTGSVQNRPIPLT